MIHWMNDQYTLQNSVAVVIVRLIFEGQITIENVSSCLNMSDEEASRVLTDHTEELTPEMLRNLFEEFCISPLFLFLQIGDPMIDVSTNTGRVLKALNQLLAGNIIKSLPEYNRILEISDLEESKELLKGRLQLKSNTILNICQKFSINPAFVFSPTSQTPIFL